jgi:hypothetical protein
MALLVYRDRCENFNSENFNHNECDSMGFVLMATHISTINNSTIDELVFRIMFIEKVSYPLFAGCEKLTAKQIRDLLNKYKGLTINCSDLSRAKFVRIVIKNVERDIEYSTKTKN